MMAAAESTIEVDRRLAHDDPRSREPSIIAQLDITALDKPIIILGDPGMGKSILTQALGRLDGYVYVRAASFVRNAHPERLLGKGECLVIDGLDEVASATIGGGVDAVLSQLSRMGYPPFILSSREVDWRGASDRIKIEDDYSRPATLLHLLPFDADDAGSYLARNFPTVDSAEILHHLAGARARRHLQEPAYSEAHRRGRRERRNAPQQPRRTAGACLPSSGEGG
jgi:hypothetical protein